MVNLSIYSLKLVKESGGRYDLPTKSIHSPKDVYKVVEEVFHLSEQAEEVLVMLTVDRQNNISGCFKVSQGSVASSIVHPREIFKRAVLANASSIILAHNHPAGSTTPSKEDKEVTKRIEEAGKIMGIELLDHIIVGDNNYSSFKEDGLL